MKALITLTLMLITFSLFGQHKSYDIKNDSILINESGYYIISGFITGDTVSFKPIPRDERIRNLMRDNYTIIMLYDYYKEDCYNDSTLGYLPSHCDIPGCLVYHYPEIGYIHKQPTFEGFINWINEKLK